ncbi:MAG: 5-formyltetrahydrofolate cyclo-ligase [Pedosphaera sp.]|nr:5-formyltetrahydrofolate cyclo-ligase [Pedosphaera sp.]
MVGRTVSVLSDDKKLLRTELKRRIAALPATTRAAGAIDVIHRILARAEFQRARAILMTWPLPDEINLWPLASVVLRSHAALCLPRYNPSTGGYDVCQIQHLDGGLREGPFGIMEPAPDCSLVPPEALDFCLVPGLGFDSCGQRLGRGRGFFDRLLATVRGVTCGAGYDEQMVSRVPIEPHDVQLNLVLTPSKTHECRVSQIKNGN